MKRSTAYNAVIGLLIALMLPLLLWRISLESSLWCDEIFSILLAHESAAETIDQTATDRHPPGYYLALRGWFALGRTCGLEPGVFWGRLPGVIGWLGLVAAAWFLGRREFGRGGGSLIAWSVAIAAQSAYSSKDMRPYATAYPALFICFLLLLALRGCDDRADRARAVWGWVLYGLCAATALWSHMLAAPLLGFHAVMWVGLALGIRPGRRRGFLLRGLVAQAAALISFAPWLPEISSNVRHLLGDRLWMTPATLKTWSMVFTIWYPFGRHGGESPGWMACGLATLALPAISIFWPTHAPRRVPARWKRLALWGAALALANVTMLWLVDRAGWMLVFHGPRYTVFTVAPWACGLVGLSQWARIRAGWPQWFAWALMAPWLIASITGLALDLRHEMNQGFTAVVRATGNPMPAPGTPVYVIPSELISFQSRTLLKWEARPIERIADIPPGADASILILNNWQTLTAERDMIVLGQIKTNRLAKSSTPIFIPPHVTPPDLDYFTLLRVRGWNHELAEKLGRDRFRAQTVSASNHAVARIAPEQLRMRDGWHFLQVDDDLQPYRWSADEWTSAKMPKLKPGRYTIRVRGFRAPMAEGTTSLGLQLPGRKQVHYVQLGAAGSFDFSTSFVVDRADSASVLRIHHPIYDARRDNSGGSWFVGIAFYGLWVEETR